MLDQSYSKTDAGRAEIKARALPLSRSARNLLLVLDASKPARQWLSLVQGVTEPDLAFLLQQGLIASRGPDVDLNVGVAVPAAAAELPPLDYQQLYALLSGQASKQLGLMKGYKFVLEIEQCRDLAELQKLALSLVERVQQGKGDDAARLLRQALGLRT